MKQVLIIAGGVFLGISALLIVRAIPGWMAERRESQAMSVIQNLTSPKVLARCGKPIDDDVIWAGDRALTRTLSYEGIYGTVKVRFSYTSDNKEVAGAYLDAGPFADSTERYKLAVLPCLSH